MNKHRLYLFIALLIVICALVLRLASPRNRWICEGGKWIEHGKPISSRPLSSCPDEFSVDKEIKALSSLLSDEFSLSTSTIKVERENNEEVQSPAASGTKAFLVDPALLNH